jgi:hypothetical protein
LLTGFKHPISGALNDAGGAMQRISVNTLSTLQTVIWGQLVA